MTADDSSRLTQLSPFVWVDLDEVVAVRISCTGMISTKVARLMIRGGAEQIIAIPDTYAETYSPLQEATNAERIPAWLLAHGFSSILEGIDYSTPGGTS